MEVIRSLPVGQTIVGEPERRGDERSEAPRSGGSPTIVRDAALTAVESPRPRGHGSPRPTTIHPYKLEMLRKGDACTQPGHLSVSQRH